MSENSNDASGGLNHDAGSFTQNNASDLPGQDAGKQDTAQEQFSQTRDATTQAEVAASQKTETERRHDMTRPVMSKRGFKVARSSHQPVAEHSMETTLPDTKGLDAAKHYDLQAKEHAAAMKDQLQFVPKEKQKESERHLEPSAKDKFIAKRFEQAHGQKPSHDKSR